MSLLADRKWKRKYTRDDGDLIAAFYVPALECAVRYDRLTGFFTANALALAARGVERLLSNGGRMRLIVGCTLDAAEVTAIERGEAVRGTVESHMLRAPLAPENPEQVDGLELLAWMVANGHLEVKVALPCDERRRPLAEPGIFHSKSGVFEDKTGDRLAFIGSLNESATAWRVNGESFHVFTSWKDGDRVDDEDSEFAALWADRAARVMTLDVPAAVRDDLLRFLPAEDAPAKRVRREVDAAPAIVPPEEPPPEFAPIDLRRLVWGYIRHAPAMPNGGERVGEATCAVTPWPHQIRAFHRLYDHWPPKLLIADEVGLGKTIQAGLLLRQAWLARRAKRILILAPKNVCRQWQIELREKFNLNWPIYDGQRLTWYPSPAMATRERAVTRNEWHREPVVITSSHLMRRRDRAAELLAADPWDLVVLDEAHHARRRSPGAPTEGGPNALLALMRGLGARTQGLVLLTATPMQVHPVEIWDLLSLLGMPPSWTGPAFVRFFQVVETPNPGHPEFEMLAELFRAVEVHWGGVDRGAVLAAGAGGRLQADRILRALRDRSAIPRRQLSGEDRRIALAFLKRQTPVARLVSRHTRALLRRYFQAGKLTTPIATRDVRDEFIDLSADERAVYSAVEDYIASTYNQATARERNAVGFVMTIYRRRLASSFRALARTLEAHLAAIADPTLLHPEALEVDDDDQAEAAELGADDASELERAALAVEERDDIGRLLGLVRALPPDSKLNKLTELIAGLRQDGFGQVMVFTQFTDTMDFLRDALRRDPSLRLMCFSGRGGEIADAAGGWRRISRDDVKRRFKAGDADVLLCTDAAAEGLNFQFCGALVNYDMPWNPMRVEQRIGRIDRLGQQHATIRITNLHYRDTVESDVYQALRSRIGLFESVVGRLQPILAHLPALIGGHVLAADHADAVREVQAEIDRARDQGLDIDDVATADLEPVPRPAARLTLDDLDRVLRHPALLPPATEAKPLQAQEYAYVLPGAPESIRVTTDADYFEANAESVELWSPGSPAFPLPEDATEATELDPSTTLAKLFARLLG
jgi:SNF2 family DNA or RNA helicase